MKTRQRTLLGTGILTWDKRERVSDRYGFVWLMEYGSSLSGHKVSPIPVKEKFVGRKGRLIAHVTKTRESTHIGDSSRNVFPETPEVGEDIVLGKGRLRFGVSYEGSNTVGLEPPDTDQYPWLDVKALYRAHEQTVDLYFEED